MASRCRFCPALARLLAYPCCSDAPGGGSVDGPAGWGRAGALRAALPHVLVPSLLWTVLGLLGTSPSIVHPARAPPRAPTLPLCLVRAVVAAPPPGLVHVCVCLCVHWSPWGATPVGMLAPCPGGEQEPCGVCRSWGASTHRPHGFAGCPRCYCGVGVRVGAGVSRGCQDRARAPSVRAHANCKPMFPWWPF
jgi:hypothetical protein